LCFLTLASSLVRSVLRAGNIRFPLTSQRMRKPFRIAVLSGIFRWGFPLTHCGASRHSILTNGCSVRSASFMRGRCRQAECRQQSSVWWRSLWAGEPSSLTCSLKPSI
jgi:hypothetical protein